MNKIKVILVLIISMLISVTAISITGAEELEGTLQVEVTGPLGLVRPTLNNLTTNQSVTFSVENKGNQSLVNDTLTINLEPIINVTRESFIVHRSVAIVVVFARKFADIELMPIAGLFQRLFPVKAFYSAVLIPGKLTGNETASSINMSISYEIDNTTASENFTMHVLAVGAILPGGGAYKKINLSVTYDLPE